MSMKNSKSLPRHDCPHCHKNFKTIQCRNAHIRRFHDKEPPDCCRQKLLCPYQNCEFYYLRCNAIRKHLCTEHKVQFEHEVISFPDNRAFFTWKKNIEEENKCRYVSTGSPVKRCPKKNRSMWFNCSLSRNESSKENQQSKQDYDGKPFCPSTLRVSITDDNKFTVEYYKTHLGHDKVLIDTVMLIGEDMDDPDEISEDVPFDEVLDNARSSVCETELKNNQVLTQMDLHIKSALFEQKNCGLLCGDEFNNIRVWVHKMNTVGDYSPVAFFKQKGKSHDKLDLDDFMIVLLTKPQKEISRKFLKNIVCIDSACGKDSSDFCLTSLLAIEESSFVFPVAFCISNKTDENSMTVFFQAVRDNVGTFESPFFMSNGEPSFHIAWEIVMASDNPSPINQLLCSWDIDSCWRKHLCEIEGEEEKIITYKTLRVLLEESDVDTFEGALEGFMDELRDDFSTAMFSEYFYSEYFLAPDLWAFCYRKGFGISTDVYLDAMHQTLQNYFLEGKIVKISKVIQGLLKLTRHEVLRMPNDFINYDTDYWFSKMSECHQKSFKIDKIYPFNACNWSVQTPENRIYYVVTKKETCTLECDLKCSACNVCVHSFCCTCEDNLLLYNICQHIHACARHAEFIRETNKKAVDQKMDTSNALTEDSNFNLKVKLNVIKSMLDNEFSEKATKQLEDTFDLMILFLEKNKSS